MSLDGDDLLPYLTGRDRKGSPRKGFFCLLLPRKNEKEKDHESILFDR